MIQLLDKWQEQENEHYWIYEYEDGYYEASKEPVTEDVLISRFNEHVKVTVSYTNPFYAEGVIK